MTDTTPKLLSESGARITRRDVSLDSINVEQSLDNQVRHQALDESVVEDYAAAMERGDVFPPVIVAERDGQRWLLGGNHRFHARRKAGFEIVDAWIVHDPTEGQSKQIAFGDNSTHGKPLTDSERISHAEYLMERGMSRQKAAAHVGVSKGKLERHFSARATRKRFVDINPTEQALIVTLRPVTCSRLSHIADDEAFSITARATATYAVPTNAVYNFVTQLNKIDSVDEQRNMARKFAAEHAAVGRGTGRQAGIDAPNCTGCRTL